MRIVILGFMFSGKTTVGKRLANSLKIKHFDTDKVFEMEQNQTIADFISQFSEQEFRIREREILLKLLEEDDVVISVGGGMPCFENNMEIINRNALSIMLDISFQSVMIRYLKSQKPRALLNGLNSEQAEQKLFNLYQQRQQIYHKAQIIIKAESIDLDKLLEMIKTSIIK